MTDPLLGVPERTKRFAQPILAAAEKYGLDPLLIAAVIEHESAGGHFLRPRGPGGRGDQGHGHGLCQIDSRYHLPFLMRTDEQGVPLWKMPGDNIDYGMGLLAQYIQECGGDEDAGVAAYNAGPGKVRRVLRLLRPNATPKERRAALNSVTTHKKYVTYVYSRLDEWRSLRKEAEDGAHKAIV